ncbi:MAG: hypothetical protein FH748_08225 [Balneolaceae bacterium]|nr:hypothetical protein [Balneolaceae bacterium]
MRVSSFFNFILPAIVFLPFGVSAQKPATQQALLSNESKLIINGKSNVNDFSCVSQHNLQEDSLKFNYLYTGESISLEGLTLTLETDLFDCGKRGINRDFRNTLKHSEYPNIEITLSELISSDQLDSLTAKVVITIAGIKNHYSVELQSVSQEKNKILAKGKKKLSMEDFKLDPPSPLFGLIKVKKKLVIDFNLIIHLF